MIQQQYILVYKEKHHDPSTRTTRKRQQGRNLSRASTANCQRHFITDDLIANLANIAAILKQAFDFHWVGFYRVTEPQRLTLGPFQGPLACVTIPFSKGVCGAAARMQTTIIVPNVEAFPGHIACSSLSKSEIVVPLVHAGQTQLILDIDSDVLNGFDDVDQLGLERIVGLIAKQHFTQ